MICDTEKWVKRAEECSTAVPFALRHAAHKWSPEPLKGEEAMAESNGARRRLVDGARAWMRYAGAVFEVVNAEHQGAG
jgi:hypothetical protein